MTIVVDGTNGLIVPTWTTATRPSSPTVGQMGYNSTTGLFDQYTASGWSSLIAGVAGIANGGTNGTATPTAGAVAYGNGTSYAFTSAGTTGQALLSNGSSPPTWGTAGVSTGKSIAMAMIFGF